MSRIVTPLGKIHIAIDGKDLLYNFEQLEPAEKLCAGINGRFKIAVKFVPDGKAHKIECTFPKVDFIRYEHSSESGERLECNSFYRGNAKLSIGIESDAGYIDGNIRVSETGYDYDSEYLDNGIAYVILPNTKTEKYVFGICWIDECTVENDVQTWFGADPTLMK